MKSEVQIDAEEFMKRVNQREGICDCGHHFQEQHSVIGCETRCGCDRMYIPYWGRIQSDDYLKT